MDSSANNSRQNAMSNECDRDASASTSTSPATAETSTTISTIVLQSHPIQIVVGLLQVRIKNASSFAACRLLNALSPLDSLCADFNVRLFFFYIRLYLALFVTLWPSISACFNPSPGMGFSFCYLSVFEYSPLNITL